MTDLKDLLRNRPTLHYYGDIVRILFVTAGLIMLITLPFFGNLIPVPYFASIIIILTIAILAGLTNPVQKWIAMIDTGVSVVAFVGFEYYAIQAFSQKSDFLFFSINQVLAIIFFVALYYSTKTLRGKMLGEK